MLERGGAGAKESTKQSTEEKERGCDFQKSQCRTPKIPSFHRNLKIIETNIPILNARKLRLNCLKQKQELFRSTELIPAQKWRAGSVNRSCPTLRQPVDCSPPGSSVHGISQARILQWLPFPPPGGLPHPGKDLTSPVFPASEGIFFTAEPPGKPSCPDIWGQYCWYGKDTYLPTPGHNSQKGLESECDFVGSSLGPCPQRMPPGRSAGRTFQIRDLQVLSW